MKYEVDSKKITDGRIEILKESINCLEEGIETNNEMLYDMGRNLLSSTATIPIDFEYRLHEYLELCDEASNLIEQCKINGKFLRLEQI